ncbi:hypothetical protein JO972_09860 [Verrucomicrobiaceae bacterium 5K15]|uniref:Uncharacterized protein n=1 Tax=Oceaniferula flava TaxID=2800421 RepID=A0AAE2SD83_9BACT|nr:hypothetical protein [Oceaniferula flavus]MBK1855262.1 hypothetical protein [Oceaniferula flavus]MBM1136568.1 hypothetical protein [Oceaniferula flavus]
MDSGSPSPPPNSFARQLGFWSLHCGVTAIPSFCIALTRFNSPSAIAGMLGGILTFIIGYAWLTSASFYGKVHVGLIGKAIKMGARIRMWISILSLPLLLTTVGRSDPAEELMFVPDMWFGLVALLLFSLISQLLGIMPLRQGIEELDGISTYFVTLIEGGLISVSLILIAFLALIVLNYRRNRQRLPSDFIPR